MYIPNVIGSISPVESKILNPKFSQIIPRENLSDESKLITSDKLDSILDNLSNDLNDSIDEIFNNTDDNNIITLPRHVTSDDYINNVISSRDSSNPRRVSEPSENVDTSDEIDPNIKRVSEPSENVDTSVTIPRNEPYSGSDTDHRDETFGGGRHDTVEDPLSTGVAGLPSSPNSFHGDPGNLSSTEELAQLIRSSSAYQNAYKVFSSDKKHGKSFLVRLESIPDSILTANETLWDNLGLSNNAEDIKRAAYNDALIAIQNLLAEYYQYINSLPTTQVQQMWDAGINSAITGQSISGSNLSSTPQNNTSGSLPSTNSGTYIASLANILLSSIPSSIGTIATAFSSLKNVRANQQNARTSEMRALSDLWMNLNDMGYSLEGVSFDSWEDVTTWQQNLKLDSKAQSKELQKYIDNFYLDIQKNALSSQRGGDNLTDNFGVTLEEFYNDLGNHLINQYVYEQKFNAVKAQYDYEYYNALSASDASNATNYSNKFGYASHKFQISLIQDRLDFINKWKRKIYKSNDPVAKSSFVEYLMGVNDTYLGRAGGVIRTIGSIL